MKRAWKTVMWMPALILFWSDATSGQTYQLGNSAMTLTFQNTAPKFELTSILNTSDPGLDPTLSLISMAPDCGRWTVKLVDKNNLNNVLFFDANGVPGTVTIDLPNTVATGQYADIKWVRSVWTGTLTFAGSANVPFQVNVFWLLQGQIAYADTLIRVVFLTPGPFNFYLSEVRYPDVLVRELPVAGTTAPGATDQFLVPFFIGHIIRDPTHLAGFPDFLGNPDEPVLYSLQLSAYYNDLSGNCLFVTTSDGGDDFKIMRFTRALSGTGGPGHVGMHLTQVPENVYSVTDYTTPYAIRLGVTKGDWLDVADAYQSLLKVMPNTYYTAPVASPNNLLPQRAKNLVAESFMASNYLDDNLDSLERNVLEWERLLGTGANGSGTIASWYLAHYPDIFDHFYADSPDNYLPGRPSFGGAIREAQKQFAHVAAPYVNTTAAQDVTTQNPPLTPDAYQQSMIDAFLYRENQHTAPDCIPGVNCPPAGMAKVVCQGTAFWKSEFVNYIADIGEFTDMGGVYLDAFGTRPCYRLSHAGSHPLGGGKWVYGDRMQQVHDLKAAMAASHPADPEFVCEMEGAEGRFTAEMHMMHVDPQDVPITTGPCPDDPCTTCVVQPLDQARTIPLFRAIFDNVKMGRIGGAVAGSPGVKCWAEANNVLTFGLLPEFPSPLIEAVPIFYDRHQLPYSQFVVGLVQLLRDEGLLLWHNGTLRRLPSLQITGGPSIAPDEPGLMTDAGHVREPTYYEEVLVPGMFQAPSDLTGALSAEANSLAYAIVNPWIQSTGDFTFAFTFDPALYPNWQSVTSYSYEKHQLGQPTTCTTVNTAQPVVINGSLAPGKHAFWVFRTTTCP